ncbi:hypothetical protein [Paenibacillus lutrae]|uniref:Uncharacterized protein n=1 Tax=Paenibacillus lutrae TaxID=2078573 RepID=A0A7X3FGX8_9BACL|nr:hypothetical protein [Paenibacillus lutrae]MVO99554.1 hypothetical protein [Paenibacillus lutrae]
MKKYKRRIILIVGLLVFGLYLLHISEYSFSQEGALKDSFPQYNGDIVFEQNFKNNKVVILKGPQGTYAKLIKSKWKILFRVTNVSVLGPMYPEDESILRTWSANLNSNKRYDTILAVEVSDPKIMKVIITNEQFEEKASVDLNEIKENSKVFIELDVVNGYAGTFQEMAIDEVGGFVFRGVDNTGSIKYFGR